MRLDDSNKAFQYGSLRKLIGVSNNVTCTCSFTLPYSGNLLQEEIFANLMILLSEEIFVIFELITSYVFSMDNINPKIYTSFYFC